jgi:hypothetical protein
VVGTRMRAAYRSETALSTEAQLESLAGELDHTHPAPPHPCARPRRDADRAAPGCAAYPCQILAIDQLREELGAALVRRHG